MLNFHIEDFLNEEEGSIFNMLISYFKENNIKAYVVGGAVRDALLKIAPKDIDIAVEGDVEAIIKNIPKVEKTVYHERFKTSSVYFKNGIQFDIIRCRKERYAQNGSLPEVYPSNIYDDLDRRDFTVNAIAYDIINGCIIDPYQGVEHIKRRIIKKIKCNSYREDPTRIFRAIRYSVRYGFSLGDEDEILNCIQENVFSTISFHRIMKEILLMAGENRWQENIKKCFSLGIFKPSKEFYFNNDLELEKKWASLTCEEELKPNVSFNIRLCNIYLWMDDANIKNIFKNNSILEKSLKKAFEQYEHIEKKLMESKDNYDIFNILYKCNIYHLELLKYNRKLQYKLLNYMKLKDNYKDIKTKILLDLGVEKGRLIRDIIEEVKKVNLNTLLDIKEDYLRNNIGEIIDGIKHKNTQF